MARNDGIDRTVARNQDLETPADVAKVQEHNEREKDSYSNQDIVPERTSLNVHFKAPTDDYVKMFEQMEQDGVISTRGLKPDAVKYGELVFDVNSAYFYNHGGYEFAKQFYADAYKAAAEIVGAERAGTGYRGTCCCLRDRQAFALAAFGYGLYRSLFDQRVAEGAAGRIYTDVF